MSTELSQEQKTRIMHYSKIANLLKAMKERFGEDAYQVLVEQNGEEAIREWREIALSNDDNSIETLIKCLWEPLRDEGFEYELEERGTGFQLKCTRCGLYDLARHLGITEEAYYMFCEADPYITEGFNPNIGFKRTKTLMQGHGCCDHYYYMKA